MLDPSKSTFNQAFPFYLLRSILFLLVLVEGVDLLILWHETAETGVECVISEKSGTFSYELILQCSKSQFIGSV